MARWTTSELAVLTRIYSRASPAEFRQKLPRHTCAGSLAKGYRLGLMRLVKARRATA
jgi:hypothetical protein